VVFGFDDLAASTGGNAAVRLRIIAIETDPHNFDPDHSRRGEPQ